MSYFLPDSATEAEKNKLRAFIKKSKEPHARDRTRAVLWRMEGKSRETIASLLGINKDTVSNWITFYRQKGIEGLKSNWKGGNKYKLSPSQKEEVKRTVRSKSPKDFGYGKDFWDVALLARYIKEKHGVYYASDRSYHRLFAFIGFTYHKPAKQDRKRRQKKVAEFEAKLRKKGGLVRRMMLSSWSKMK